ncbi:uncharacterized [Lates japonicus]
MKFFPFHPNRMLYRGLPTVMEKTLTVMWDLLTATLIKKSSDEVAEERQWEEEVEEEGRQEASTARRHLSHHSCIHVPVAERFACNASGSIWGSVLA